MMKKMVPTVLIATLLIAPAPLLAGGRGDAILGGALGGALGAAVGSELGGRDGAIVGSAVGGATGAALATRRHRRSQPIYVDRRHYVSPRDRDYGPPPPYYRSDWRRDHYHRRRHRHHHDGD